MLFRFRKIEPRPRYSSGPAFGLPRLMWVVAVLSFVQGLPASAQEPPSNGAAESPPPSATDAAEGTPPPASESPVPPRNGAANYLYDRTPQQGTVVGEVMEAQGQAKTSAMAQEALGFQRIEDKALRSRFEEFLGMEAVSAERLEAYQDASDKVLELLRSGQSVEAWKRLLVMADFQEIDAGVSWELANRIESIWNADRTTNVLSRSNDRMRDEIGRATRNADFLSDKIREDDLDYQRRSRQGSQKEKSGGNLPNGGVPSYDPTGGGGGGSPSVESVLGKLELTETYLRSLELKAQIKLNELKAEKLYDQSKNDFAEYITTLYESGRHRHVLIAADFWRRIFAQGEYPVAMAQQVNAALEMHRDVDRTIDVFEYRLSQKEVSAALDRLQSAFMVNEFHPAVLGLPREKKQQVEAFTSRLDRMQNMMEARDFGALENLLTEMKEIAPDFDMTKPMAMVNAVKLESRLRLGKAKLAAQQGDLDKAMEEFQTAAQAWPGNPDLETSASTFFKVQDTQSQSLVEFDRMYAEGNYRGIFDQQLMFAPSMKDDAERQEQLKAALEKVTRASMALEKERMLREAGDWAGAWEVIELAVEDWPEDLQLNQQRASLAGRNAEYSSVIHKAREAEARDDVGLALTLFAQARMLYPSGKFANQGVTRLSKLILNPDQSSGESQQGEESDAAVVQ